MNHIKKFYNDLFCNTSEYDEYICMVREEYDNIIDIIDNTTDVKIIRSNSHKLLGILLNLLGDNIYENDLIYLCKILLKNNKNTTSYSIYIPFIENIVKFDKKKLVIFTHKN